MADKAWREFAAIEILVSVIKALVVILIPTVIIYIGLRLPLLLRMILLLGLWIARINWVLFLGDKSKSIVIGFLRFLRA